MKRLHGVGKVVRKGTQASPPRRLLVVGNGPTGVAAGDEFHVDLTCGSFLLDLADAGEDVVFLQPAEDVELSLNYYGCILPQDRVRAIALDRRTLSSTLRTSSSALRALTRADFIYLFFPGKLPRLIARLCRLLSKPYGVYLRGDMFMRGGSDARLLRRARFVTAASRGLADQARALGARLRLIRPMCDFSVRDALGRDHAARRPGPVRLLFVGRIERSKGVLELLEAVRMVQADGTPVQIKLVGWGDLHDKLASRYALQKSAGVEITGAVEDRKALMALYEEADIFVLPTHHEGFPRVLYEAMIKSTAIVTTMVGGIPSLMRDGYNCIAVPIRDAPAIADAIKRLGTDPSLRQRLAAAAMQTAIEVLETLPPHAEAMLGELQSARNRNAH